MEPKESWLRDPAQIRAALREFAGKRLSYSTALIASRHLRELVGNLDIMPKGAHEMSFDQLRETLLSKRTSEQARIEQALTPSELEQLIDDTHSRLEASIDVDDETWKIHIPGRPIVSMFCNRANMPEGRFRNMYIREAALTADGPFQEIVEVFKAFSDA